MNDDRDLSLPELSEAELDQISGGIDIYLSGSIFEQRSSFSRQSRQRQTHARGMSNTFSSAFQFVGLGFNSVEDVLSVLKSLSNLFGRRN